MRPHALANASFSILLAIASTLPLAAQDDDHAHAAALRAPAPSTAGLGVVHFPNSGSARAKPAFTRGIALLHSFAYRPAADAFRDAERADPAFALPYWFEALSHSAILWNIEDLSSARAALARLGATPAERLAKAGTPRERAYGAAVEAFYADTDLTTRTHAFADSLSALASRDTTDLEASAFASIANQMYASQRNVPAADRAASVARAVAFGTRVYHANPRHPGAAHYLIHVSDIDNAYTPQALQPALDYASIAPAVEHAQHMPAHVFLKLGMWHDEVASNERAWHASVEQVTREQLPKSRLDFHDFTWLQYGYLQEGRWRAARALIDSAQRMIALADTGAALTVDAHYAPAMLQFSYASETERWNDGPSGPAGTPVGPPEARARENAMLFATDFAREAAAFMQGDTVAAMRGRPFADSTLQGLELRALLAERRGNRDSAMTLWRRAAALEDAIPTVGPPRFFVARDRLAALLLAAGRPSDAAAEYERSLNHAPNRSAALLGVARARAAAGDTASSAMAYRRLLDNWRHADADLPGLAEARRGAAWAAPSRVEATSAPIVKQRVLFKNGPLVLEGFLFKPQGAGPFPAVVWNHGSEKNPGASAQFDSVAGVFMPHGYVVFAPTRRGHGQSDGELANDARGRVQAAKGEDAANRFITQALAGDQLSDQLAGLAFLKRLPFVDTTRMVVAGCSFGGIQTLLAAEGGHGFKAALPISPAALNWDRNPPLRARLVSGVARIKIPVLLLQPPHDASLGPSRDLGAEFARLHKAYSGKIYPDTIPPRSQTHCFGGAMGDRVWAADAVAFFDSVLASRRR